MQNEQDSEWLTDKPTFNKECILLTASFFNDQWIYNSWQIKELYGEGFDNKEHYYWAWLNMDGEEYGDLSDLTADRYKIISPIE